MNGKRKTLILLFLFILPAFGVEEDVQEIQEKIPKYGYQDGEITQGVGYGHHLHPMYFRGNAKKYYRCAVEDDWLPMASSTKPQKTESPPKKYNRLELKKKKPVRYYKKRYKRPYSHGPRRSERILAEDPRFKAEHTKFLQDINALSDSRLAVDQRGENFEDTIGLESEQEMTINSIESGTPEDYNRHGYRVEEHPDDIPPPVHKKRKKVPPFQTYKKFKIITLKPSSVSTVKFNYPRSPQEYSQDLIPPPPNPYPYPYEPISYEMPLKVRAVRQPPPKPPQPGLTLLEQFLLLFPKFIS